MSYVSLQNRINAMEFASNRELCQGLLDAMQDAIHIPNTMLPEEMHNNKEYTSGAVNSTDGKCFGQSGKRVLELVKSRNEKNEAAAAKEAHAAEKARRVELYRQQMEFLETINYEPLVESQIKVEKLAKAFA